MKIIFVTNYTWFTNTQKYNFGTGYTFDETTKKFILTGDIKQLTWNDSYEEIVNNQLYSCLDMGCNVVYKIVEYVDDKTMKVKPISYSSNSLLSAQTNQTDSPIKTKLDNWYQSNLVNYSSYIADETFCDDRSVVSGDGYKLDSNTQYGAYDRLENKRTPSLKCGQENDKFRVSSSSAKLEYPISLIIADEVALAGGAYNATNTNYYLYNSKPLLTLSPSLFNYSNSYACVWYVRSSRSLYPWFNVTYSNGVRPVINLKSDVTIAKGDGSSINPFVIN